MAKILTVFNQKGGCGKTMTAMQLAGTCAMRGNSTLVVDMDSQGTALVWSTVKPDPQLRLKATGFPAKVESFAPLGRGMVRPVADLAPLYDLIIIDTPPAVASEAPWAALQISDLALIPFVPTAADMWAKEARVLARKAMEQNPDIRGVHHLPSMVRRGNTIAGVLDQFRSDPEVALLSSTVSLLNAYLDSQMLGLCVGQLSSSSTAAKEMSALSDEVLGLLGLSKSVEGKRKGKR